MAERWRVAPDEAWVLVLIPFDSSSDPLIVVRHGEKACFRALRESGDPEGEFDDIADGPDLIAAFAEFGTRVLVERRDFAPQFSAPEVWECGPHANAWNGHDARCRRVDHSLDGRETDRD